MSYSIIIITPKWYLVDYGKCLWNLRKIKMMVIGMMLRSMCVVSIREIQRRKKYSRLCRETCSSRIDWLEWWETISIRFVWLDVMHKRPLFTPFYQLTHPVICEKRNAQESKMSLGWVESLHINFFVYYIFVFVLPIRGRWRYYFVQT